MSRCTSAGAQERCTSASRQARKHEQARKRFQTGVPDSAVGEPLETLLEARPNVDKDTRGEGMEVNTAFRRRRAPLRAPLAELGCPRCFFSARAFEQVFAAPRVCSKQL